MQISIVSTLYRSAGYIEELVARCSAEASKHSDAFEIILVNDGSPDDDLAIAISLLQTYSNLKIIDLSRNFGHHKAMMTGMAEAEGDLIYLLDSDLEEDPEWLGIFLKLMNEKKSDVVFGAQMKRRGNWFEKLSGAIFYRLFRFLTKIDQPDNIVTARLMTKRYVKALLRHQEREINIGGLWVLTGFDQQKCFIEKKSTSPTTYTFGKKVSQFVNVVTSLSSFPLILSFYIGTFTLLTSMTFVAGLLLRLAFGGTPPPGYLSLMASIWFFSGLTISLMSIQGIYISKLFSEVKQRPYSIIREIYTSPKVE